MRASPIDSSALAPFSASGPERARPRQTFLQVLERRDERAPQPSDATTSRSAPLAGPARSADATAGAGLRALVTRTLRAEDRIDRLIAAAATGKTFSAGQLLALQATAFRYSQTVEVLSRAADRLVGSIKQTLGTQV
jgi:hypothetical protein